MLDISLGDVFKVKLKLEFGSFKQIMRVVRIGNHLFEWLQDLGRLLCIVVETRFAYLPKRNCVSRYDPVV